MRGHQPVAGQVPQRGPGQRAGERVGQVAEAVAQRRERVLVEADLAVRQVVVVDQHQRGPDQSGQLGHLGARRGGDVQLDLVGADQPPLLVAVVQADRDPVRPEHRVARGGLLEHRERGDPAVRVGHQLRRQHVHPGRLQPGAGPLGHGVAAPARGLGEHRQQVGQGGVAEGVALEVPPRALEERLRPDVRHQLLQHRRALGVGDAVEVELGVLQVVDVRRDRVRRRQLVLPVGPGLAAVGEGDPPGVVPGRGDLRVRAHEVRERLLQPQVVPPLHGDQVAEPHVRHLVQDDVGPGLVGGVGHLGAEDELLAEGDQARVLHRADVVLRYERLVVLAEGVRVVELVVEEVQALLGDGEDLVRVEVLRQRGPAHRGQRDLQAAAVRQQPAVVVPGDVVRPGDDGGDVAGDARRRGEAPGQRVALGDGVATGGGVGEHRPVGRRGHREAVRRLQVGLLEGGEHPARVGGLVLGVEVGLAVDRVGEPVQPLARTAVRALGLDQQFVVLGQPGQGDPGAVEHRRRVELGAVQHHPGDRGREQVGEAVRAGLGAAEAQQRTRAKTPGALPVGDRADGRTEVELDVVAVHAEDAGPLAGFVAGQIAPGHCATP